MTDKMTHMGWEQYYSDNSGVELGIYFRAKEHDEVVIIESVDTIEIPASKARWLLEKLDAIVMMQNL